MFGYLSLFISDDAYIVSFVSYSKNSILLSYLTVVFVYCMFAFVNNCRIVVLKVGDCSCVSLKNMDVLSQKNSAEQDPGNRHASVRAQIPRQPKPSLISLCVSDDL